MLRSWRLCLLSCGGAALRQCFKQAMGVEAWVIHSVLLCCFALL
jgi:hypothetical protein